jgi:riboflavin synthase
VRFRFELLSGELGRYLVPKGSVALDGVSLTVGEAFDSRFSVYLIPHTLQVTALADRQPGDEVNVEVDILAKYMERLVNRESDLGMAKRSVPPHARGDHP